MTALKSLTFTTMPVMGGNPTLDRRANVIARLEDRSACSAIRTTAPCTNVGQEGRSADTGR